VETLAPLDPGLVQDRERSGPTATEVMSVEVPRAGGGRTLREIDCRARYGVAVLTASTRAETSAGTSARPDGAGVGDMLVLSGTTEGLALARARERDRRGAANDGREKNHADRRKSRTLRAGQGSGQWGNDPAAGAGGVQAGGARTSGARATSRAPAAAPSGGLMKRRAAGDRHRATLQRGSARSSAGRKLLNRVEHRGTGAVCHHEALDW